MGKKEFFENISNSSSSNYEPSDSNSHDYDFLRGQNSQQAAIHKRSKKNVTSKGLLKKGKTASGSQRRKYYLKKRKSNEDNDSNFQNAEKNEKLKAIFGGKHIRKQINFEEELIPFIGRQKIEEYKKSGFSDKKIGFIQRMEYERNRFRRQYLRRKKLKQQSQKIHQLQSNNQRE